ncbi:MAG: hypothetical protein GXO71_05820 [Caldiserica bacterium]|nr:hypothetical protein [Caldisericota bacterium]
MRKFILLFLSLLILSELRGEGIEVFLSPHRNLEDILIREIKEAREEITGALYIVRGKVGEALIKARRRGVKVSILVEEDNAYAPFSFYPRLHNENMARIDKKKSLMHHKFLVMDKKKVLTGSYNPGASPYQFNDLILLDSEKLAENYLQEFAHLENRKSRKGYNNTVYISGIKVENYFTPGKETFFRVKELLEGAKESIYFSQFSFTHKELAKCILRKQAKGAEVKGIVDYYESRQSSPCQLMKLAGLKVIEDRNYASRWHSKFVIIDRKIVITGSLNLSYSAFKRNNENILIIYSPAIARRYGEEFGKYFKLWEGRI